jgi:hypothetical protein
MNTTARHHAKEKSKTNGKWLSNAVGVGEKQAIAKGQVILEMAQDAAEELLNNGGKLARNAGSQAISYGKSHPVQVAVGSVILGIFLGTRFLGRRSWS